MEKNDNALLIPFVKAVRVGNFKLWRSKYPSKPSKDTSSVECMNVSNLEGSWHIRIPATHSMFSVIANGYATVDNEMRENFLGMVLTNIYNVSTIGSTALHDAFFFLTEMMTVPYLLLPEKEMKKRLDKSYRDAGFDKDKRKKCVGDMMSYRRQLYELIERKKSEFIDEYERQLAERRDNAANEEEMMKRDSIAEEAMKIALEDEHTS